MIVQAYDFHTGIQRYLTNKQHTPIYIVLTINHVEPVTDSVSIVDTAEHGSFLCETFTRKSKAMVYMRIEEMPK